MHRAILSFGTCAGLENAKEGRRLLRHPKYGMKRDFNAWLASLDPRRP
jgi:hypothetical protein